jgi:hypothetical protein
MNSLKLLAVMTPLLVAAAITPCCTARYPTDTVREGFLNPPDSARPGVYWYFMDGNTDSLAMRADLESMREAGIGYVLYLEVNVGIPRGKVDFLSDQWQEYFRYAVKQAERLGIRLVLGSGPGWAGSGGPWVTPLQSMIHLVASDTTVTGPAIFEGELPVPQPKKPFFGDESLTERLRELRNNWYEDVAVIAFPATPVDERISDADYKALYYRAPYTSQPGVLPFIAAPAGVRETPGASIDTSRMVLLTDKLKPGGKLVWNIPPGKWTIMRFGKRNNGAVTRPAPAPGLGFEADKFDTASFHSHYNAYIGKLIEKVKPEVRKNGGGWTMIHIDSWEMGAQNWSPDFKEQFIRRRGYDPLPYLPVYAGRIVNSRETSERFLWDLRQTSNELIAENHAGYFKMLGQKNGFRLSIEPYDMNPAADFDLGAVADIPMCEFWSDGFGFNSAFSCIEATSIAHVKGLPVVAAESFTADSPEAWKQYPGRMKNQGDWAFCMGINRFFYHTFAHKPLPECYRPGMTMGPYGVHWDRGQTWWPMAGAYHKYIARCQFVLSQGRAVADILYLTPEGAPQVFLPPKSALGGSVTMPDKKGYSFDDCSPAFLVRNASVNNGMVTFPGGGSYRILVLPQIETMTPELVEKIEELLESGATVAGNPPKKSPSLTGYPECDSVVRSVAARIWGAGGIPSGLTIKRYGSGRLICGQKLMENISVYSAVKDSLNLYPDYNVITSFLAENGLRPDFSASGDIRYTHRKLDDRDIYFISNRSGSQVYDTCHFRNGRSDVQVWDPVTAEITSAACFQGYDGTYEMPVRLDPYQSYFVVFYKDARFRQEENIRKDDLGIKQHFLTLGGPWDVSFDTAWGGPANIVFRELTDWSKRPEKGIRYYSGSAVYTKSFDLPDNKPSPENCRYFLDLGTLKNMGRVKLNGKDAGVVWTSPWQVDVTGILKEKGNRLEITVANLWINRLIGDENFPWDGIKDGKWPGWLTDGTKRPTGRYSFTTHRFYRKDDPLVESGLIGPVSILILK